MDRKNGLASKLSKKVGRKKLKYSSPPGRVTISSFLIPSQTWILTGEALICDCAFPEFFKAIYKNDVLESSTINQI